MEDWAEALGLSCLIVRSRSTCVRAQRESIVDTIWASRSAVGRIRNWMVQEKMETLSDYVYITMEVGRGELVGERDEPLTPTASYWSRPHSTQHDPLPLSESSSSSRGFLHLSFSHVALREYNSRIFFRVVVSIGVFRLGSFSFPYWEGRNITKSPILPTLVTCCTPRPRHSP